MMGKSGGALYEASNLTFDGSGDDYIDTGIKLHDSEKNFRITLTASVEASQQDSFFRYLFVSCIPADASDKRNLSLCFRARSSVYKWLDLRWGKRGTTGYGDISNLNVTSDRQPITMTIQKSGMTLSVVVVDVNGTALINTTRTVIDAEYHDTNLFLNMPTQIQSYSNRPCACTIHHIKVETL
jgi:hypothetical protein